MLREGLLREGFVHQSVLVSLKSAAPRASLDPAIPWLMEKPLAPSNAWPNVWPKFRSCRMSLSNSSFSMNDFLFQAERNDID